MLINYTLCLWICTAVIFAVIFGTLPFFYFLGVKNIELSKNGKRVFVIFLFGLFILGVIGLNLPDVYIVDNTKHTHKNIIGRYSVKFDNGDVVTIKGNCVVNNSTQTLYVETVEYSSSFHVNLFKPIPIVEKIMPYTVYQEHINYAFENPPQSISVKKRESKKSVKNKWLHY
jgi:hypothetical protein